MRPPSWPSFGCISRCNEVENRMQYTTARATAKLEGCHNSPSVAMTHGGKNGVGKECFNELVGVAEARYPFAAAAESASIKTRGRVTLGLAHAVDYTREGNVPPKNLITLASVVRSRVQKRGASNASYSRRRRADSGTKCSNTHLLNVRTAQGVRLSLWSVVARTPFFPSACEGFSSAESVFQPPRPALS